MQMVQRGARSGKSQRWEIQLSRRLLRQVIELGGSEQDVLNLLTKNGKGNLLSLGRKVVEYSNFVFRCIPVVEKDKSEEEWTQTFESFPLERDECVFIPELIKLSSKKRFKKLGDAIDHFGNDSETKFASQQHL